MLHTTNEVHADEKPWRLEYRRGPEAPSNCPDESYLRTALAAKNGAPEPFSDNASRTITIDLVPTAERIEAHIQARNEQDAVVAEEIAHAPRWRCDQLADRIVFVLHDIIDPVTLPEPKSPQISTILDSPPLRDKPAAKAETTIIASPPVPKQTGKTLSNRRLSVSLGLGASWWNAPHTAFTSVLGIGGQWPRFYLGIEGRYDRAWDLPVNQSILAEQLALGIVSCGHHAVRTSRVDVRGCLLVDLTRLSIETDRVLLSEFVTSVVYVGARAGAGFSLARNWNIELNADAIIAVQQPRFAFNVQEYWQLPRFNGALRASVVGLWDVF
ncbi:MAG TPA: hypothetical protein PK156_42685 [Polyangium sp.]|nr:hypothetical protein [Polyangium sp.]